MQELENLKSILVNKKVSVVSDSNPRVATVLDDMREVFKLVMPCNSIMGPESKFLKESKLSQINAWTHLWSIRQLRIKSESITGSRSLTRIHVHTLAYQAILTVHGSTWENSVGAAAKASLTAHRHVCGSSVVSFALLFSVSYPSRKSYLPFYVLFGTDCSWGIPPHNGWKFFYFEGSWK